MRSTYDCDICGKTYASANSLKTHKNRHDQVTVIKCSECSYQTYQEPDLISHKMRKHDKIQITCNICDKQFRKDYLARHMKTAHFEVRINCGQCDYSTPDKEKLKRHENAVHKRITHDCKLCDYKATFLDNLNRHIKSVHCSELEKQKFICSDCSFATKTIIFTQKK